MVTVAVLRTGCISGTKPSWRAPWRRAPVNAGSPPWPSRSTGIPARSLTPGQEPRLLTTVERKASIIERSGIDVLVVLAFTAEFSRIPAQDFVRDVLVGGVHASHAVMGENFTFGHKAAGTIATLPEMGAPYGLTAEGWRWCRPAAGRCPRPPSARRCRPEISSGPTRPSDAGSCWTARWSRAMVAARAWATPRRTCAPGRGSCCPVRASMPAPPSTGDVAIGPPSTWVRIPPSAWNRCTWRRSCWISKGGDGR